MAISVSPYQKQKESFDLFKQHLDSFSQQEFLGDFQKKVEHFQQEMNEVELKNNNPKKKLKGKLPTKHEVLEFVVKSSGYNKWKITNSFKGDLREKIENIKDHYDVSFDEACSYDLSFETNNYGVVSMLVITCLPGYFYIIAGDGKVTFGTEDLLTLNETKKWLASCFK